MNFKQLITVTIACILCVGCHSTQTAGRFQAHDRASQAHYETRPTAASMVIQPNREQSQHSGNSHLNTSFADSGIGVAYQRAETQPISAVPVLRPGESMQFEITQINDDTQVQIDLVFLNDADGKFIQKTDVVKNIWPRSGQLGALSKNIEVKDSFGTAITYTGIITATYSSTSQPRTRQVLKFKIIHP